jgi:signal transduction histidine kinase
MKRASISTSKSADPRLADFGPEFQAAFHAEDLRERLRVGKLGCALVIVLMPAGLMLDWFVYHDKALPFLGLRLLCSLLTAGLLGLHYTVWGEHHVRWMAPPIALLPGACIALMIALTDGWYSPYYAGLNLVLLAMSVVARWTVLESIAIIGGLLGSYALAGLTAAGHQTDGKTITTLVNNFYFLVLTGVITIAGNALYNRLRLREFISRFELDRNQHLLEESNRKLRELDEIKSRFFANISHELRTPLTLLLAPMEALERGLGTLNEAQIADHLRTMQGNGLRLLKLINDLLDLVRLDSKRIEVKRETVDLTHFIPGILNSASKLAEDRRLLLRSEVDDGIGRVLVDREKLEKVLLNLVINAIKFTASGGTIICRAHHRESRLILELSDTGMGIKPEDLPHVFDRFWQADSSSERKHQGTGIGLALVKELVEVQGGEVTIESVVDRGTTFFISLPWVDPPDAPTEAEEAIAVPVIQPSEARDAWLVNLYRRAELFPALTSLKESVRADEALTRDQRPRLLIADDEPDMLRFLKSQLAVHFRVLEAVDGAQAVEKTAQFLPDIVLCDMMMPEKDGLQVCRELRDRTSTRNIPILLLTARADEQTKITALTAGANDFLTKPFSMTELHLRLKSLVDSRQMQRELTRQKQILEATLEELKETESQLVQTEKLASLGRMSAGIIHEINNPLNYARTGIYALQNMGREVPEASRPDFVDILKDIDEGLTRVATIVSDLRGFSHPHEGNNEDVAVRGVVESALRFLAAELRDQVQVEVEIPAEFQVRANRNKLIQVFVNLLQNSMDALREKKFPEGQRAQLRLEASKKGSTSTLTIRDNGHGIPRETLGKIFDPFFTTKEIGAGTGLGLSICYRIITEAGGRIIARSEPGEWCEFALEFPDSV